MDEGKEEKVQRNGKECEKTMKADSGMNSLKGYLGWRIGRHSLGWLRIEMTRDGESSWKAKS